MDKFAFVRHSHCEHMNGREQCLAFPCQLNHGQMMNSERTLTPRQQQILQLASEGRTDKEIARLLGVAEGTLRTYWDRLRSRYHAHSRGEIIAKALVRPGVPDLQRYMLMKMPLFIW